MCAVVKTPLGSELNLASVPSSLSRCNKLKRLLWTVVEVLLFRTSPYPAFGWRRMLLRSFGAKIGRRCNIHSTVRIWAPWNLEMDDHSCLGPRVDCYSVDKITIGAHATVSQDAFLCTASHDISSPRMPLTTRPIVLGCASWVTARAFIGPGVTIGEGAVVAAVAVVVKDVPAWTVVGGNPALFIKNRRIRTS